MISSNIPKQKNAAILPAGGILLISKIKSFNKVMEKSVSETILKVKTLYLIPNHIIANEISPHNTGNAVLTYTVLMYAISCAFE